VFVRFERVGFDADISRFVHSENNIPYVYNTFIAFFPFDFNNVSTAGGFHKN